jgi:hypothetical protein
MSKLPSPDQVRERLRNLSTKPKDDAPKYDLQSIHNKALIDFKRVGFTGTAKAQFDELINPHLQNDRVKNLCIGWSTRHQSITFSLFDGDGLKTHIIRSATNQTGEPIKWKTYGSKTFTPSKIKSGSDVVFVASGIGEYILFELMDVSYIAPQSDSVTSGITPAMIDEVQGKTIIYLQDNDDSGRKLGGKLRELFSESVFVCIDFEHVHDKDLVHGYDFRDFANWSAVKWDARAWNVIDQMIVREINYVKEFAKCLNYRMTQGATS